MRLLVVSALTLTAGLFVAVSDDNRATAQSGPERAAKVKEIRKKFDTDFDDLKKRFGQAETQAEKRAIATEAKELAVLTAGKAIKIADENPKDDAAFDAALFAIDTLGNFGASGAEFDKAVKIVMDNHLDNPKVKDLLLIMPRFGPTGQRFLEAAAEKATNKEVKGVALFFLASAVGGQFDDEADPKRAAELAARAIELFERAVKEAPNAKVGGEDTLAKEAEIEITSLRSLGIGKPAPDVEGTDLDGKKVKLSSYKGKVVLLDMWATWCPPCVAMIPHERELVRKLAGKPFVLVGVSADNTKQDLTKFLEREPMPWVHWYDGRGGKVSKTFRVGAYPTLYLIDAKGIVRKKWVGIPGNDPKSTVLDEEIEKLLKEIG